MIERNHERKFFSNTFNTTGTKCSSSTSAANSKLHPPVDKGKYAYLYLAAMFMVETFLWGFATSFGVLLNFYEQNSSKLSHCDSQSKVELRIVGTINGGIIAASAPFVSCWIVKSPRIRRTLVLSGTITCGISLFLSSFSTSAVHVLLTQGIGYAIGGSLLYFSALSYLPEWFEERRGFANGIVFSGTGLGGAIFPLILNGLLAKFGPEWTLRIISGIFTTVTLTAVFLIRPRVLPRKSCRDRIEESASSGAEEVSSKSAFSFFNFCRNLPITFWIFILANFLQSAAFFLPGIYLPSYIHSLGRSPAIGSALLSLLNAASMVAQLVGGTLSDHFPPHLIGMISSVLGGVSVLVFWGTLGHHGYAWLFVFPLVYGFTAGMWTSLYFGVVRHFHLDKESVLPAYGLFSLSRGVGTIVAGPISSALTMSDTDDESQASVSIPGSFTKVIWFIGLALLSNGFIEVFLWLYLRFTQVPETCTIIEKIDELGTKESKLNSPNDTIA